MCVSIRALSAVFGVVFILAGIAGYVPALTPDGNLLGYFEVDSMHNIVHLVSGAIALLAYYKSEYARLYFRIFGIIYGVVAVIGFANSGNLFLMHVNMADNWLHLVIALVALYIGFLYKRAAD